MTSTIRVDDPSAAGKSLGRFKLESLLGRGGGGAVWRASDPQLGREVAIKLAGDQDRLSRSRARFQREVRALAALNHPGVAQVYEAGTAPWPVPPGTEVAFLVMEYVPGETLARRLARGRLPPPEAVRLGGLLLEGLAAAHDRLIAHRDIKPSNIMLGPDGGVKLLDLGLAKVSTWVEEGRDELVGEQVSTVVEGPISEATPLTGRGGVLGTPGYMSPEQATGDVADLRSDIWAVGLVLWEMLCGRKAVPARTPQESLQAMESFAPTDGDLPSFVPPALRRVVLRCLSRRSTDRYHHARDVLHDLARSLDPTPRPAPRWGRRVAAMTAVGLLTGLAFWWGGHLDPVPPSPTAGLEELALRWRGPVLTPDGQGVVFRAHRGDGIRFGALESGLEREIWSGPGIVETLALTPSGGEVLFELREESGPRSIWEVATAGGPARRITTGWRPALSPDGQALAFFDALDGQIAVIGCQRDGTDRRVLTTLTGPLEPMGLAYAQDGAFLWVVRSNAYQTTEVLRLDPTGRLRTVAELQAWVPPGLAATPDGRLVLVAVTSSGSHSLVGTVGEDGFRPVLPAPTLYSHPSLSGDGRLMALQSLHDTVRINRVVIDLSGERPATAGQPIGPPGNSNQPRLSPDGSALVFARLRGHLWWMDLATGVSRPFIASGEGAVNPAWAPGGEQMVFAGLRDGQPDLWLAEADGTRPRPLWEDAASDFHPVWHPDGRHVFWVSDRDGQEDLYRLRLADLEVARITEGGGLNPSVSADGALLGYVRRTSGQQCELLVHELTGELTLGGLVWSERAECNVWAGMRPRFSRQGRWLAYDRPLLEGGDIFAVNLGDPSGAIAPPVRLTRFEQPVGLTGWMDWEGPDRLLVSILQRRESILLLRDADRWLAAVR